MESAKSNSMCLVVTVLPCSTPNPSEESPKGCISCGMLDWWGAFQTEAECNEAYMKQHPEKFKK